MPTGNDAKMTSKWLIILFQVFIATIRGDDAPPLAEEFFKWLNHQPVSTQKSWFLAVHCVSAALAAILVGPEGRFWAVGGQWKDNKAAALDGDRMAHQLCEWWDNVWEPLQE